MYNIALVDDDQRILQIVQYKVKSIFNSVGIDPTITCFNNPQKLHMDTYYDVLFLDIDMPSLNGIELAQNYLQNHDDTTIIFITNKYVFSLLINMILFLMLLVFIPLISLKKKILKQD